MEQLKFKIGEFSRLGRVTVRTLRHYGEIGLLKPEIIDRQTGYRYYSAGQLQKLLAVVQLKELGFSLAEIRDLYEEDTHFPDIRTMERKIADCERELAKLRERHRRLSSIISAQKKRKSMENIYFDTLPSITVAYSRTVLENYDALGTFLVTTVAPEMARLGCECPEPGYCFTIETAGEYKEKNFEIEYCEMVSSAGKDSDIVKFKELPEVPQAICMKAYGPYDRLRGHYLALFAEIARMGYRISGAPRANYVDGCWNQEDPEKWLTIIQVPVCKD
ncbi:MAG: MerR family transcriptional regulator [Candidatus Cryptobacteroides sp.]